VLTKSDLREINKIVKSGNKVLKGEMRGGFAKLDGKLDKTINFLDKDYLRLLERVERIEHHLNLQPI